MPPKSRKAKQSQPATTTKEKPQEKPEKASDTNTRETRSKVLQPREVNKKVERPVFSSQKKNDTHASEAAASKSQPVTRSRSTSNTTTTSTSTTTSTTTGAQTTAKTTAEKNKSTTVKENEKEKDSNVAGNIKKTSVNYITAAASTPTPNSTSTSPPTPISASSSSSTAAFTTPPNSTTITTTPPGFRNPPTPASKSPIKTVDPRALVNNPISPVTPTPFTFSFPIPGRGSSLAPSQGGHTRTASKDSATTTKTPGNTPNNLSNSPKAPEGPVPKSEIIILGKFVALSKSFAELEQRIAGEFMGPKMAAIATDSTTKDEKQQQIANAAFRVHHSLHRLLSLVRSGSIEQQEAAYKICVNQWVFLARGPGFPDDEDKAYEFIDQHFAITGTAPIAAKTRINALIHFLNGARLAFVLARSHQPFVPVNKSPAGKSGNSTTTKNGKSKGIILGWLWIRMGSHGLCVL
ncbi:hypothetical protein EX30DRAFT_122397 [Ascodesmis nigricans]|uniref:Uncharacterized protein n=1 Tax=Ascodesmis nigricans TaxID=341454 RepID=A0A4S2MPJ1_9PEZI|nr:hypothetical protein EX30DRAFT_122397 [Ascodesmis nigricans]